MAGSPQWKVYDAAGVYQAACKEGEAAAAVVALYGEGATIRDGHSGIVWREGKEEVSAGESLDVCTRTIMDRARDKRHAAYIRQNGQEAYDRLMARKS